MRGLLAQLSPNEENSLRRIARGDQDLPESHIHKLKRLDLVEEIDGSVALTDVGTKRHAKLDRPEKWIADTVSIPANRRLAN
jgi:hypothetical protein